MLSRCHNPKATGYKIYGGRNIFVCQRWRDSFYNFLQDMGNRPIGMNLDRINNNEGYSKENCRWVTQKENCNNTNRNIWISFDGKHLTITQWAALLNLKVNTLQYRLYRGWSLGRALKPNKKGSNENS